MTTERMSRPGASTAVAAAPALRLTARGRRLILVGMLLVALFGLVVGRAVTSQATPDRTPAVVVQPGQTLWDIAVQADPQADPRAVIAEISDLNGLTSEVLLPGQWLAIPA